jgi:hypothetical protein
MNQHALSLAVTHGKFRGLYDFGLKTLGVLSITVRY